MDPLTEIDLGQFAAPHESVREWRPPRQPRITNAYFEGRYSESEFCQYGRSKEKRSDCKIVVLAAVVNTEGLIVRTMIYEGNRQDSTTLKEVIGSLSKETPATEVKRIVVMDAGFYTESNIN